MSLEGPVLLFDGECGLCQRSVRFLLRHEREPLLRFAPLQSDFGREALATRGLPLEPEGMVLLIGDRCLLGADAGLALCQFLRFPYAALRVLSFLPRSFRDRLYGWVARNRRRFSRNRPACPLPLESHRNRFIGLPPRSDAPDCGDSQDS